MFLESYRRHFLEDVNAAPPGGGAPAANITDPSSAPPPAASSTPPATSGAPAATPPASASWMDGLPPEIKGDPSIQLFKESGVSGLAKSWVSAQAMLGKDKVIIPGEKATDEERAAFYAKLGRPESADKYELKLPEGKAMDENFAKGFKETAFKSGLNPKQVQGMVEWYAKEAESAVQARQAGEYNQLKQSVDEYRSSLGGEEKFMARVDLAKQAVRALGDEKLNKWLKESGAGSRPEVIDHFAKLAGMMSEDKLRDGTGVAFGEDPANIQKEITEAEATLRGRMNDMPSYEVQAAVANITKLYERLENSRQPR